MTEIETLVVEIYKVNQERLSVKKELAKAFLDGHKCDMSEEQE